MQYVDLDQHTSDQPYQIESDEDQFEERLGGDGEEGTSAFRNCYNREVSEERERQERQDDFDQRIIEETLMGDDEGVKSDRFSIDQQESEDIQQALFQLDSEFDELRGFTSFIQKEHYIKQNIKRYESMLNKLYDLVPKRTGHIARDIVVKTPSPQMVLQFQKYYAMINNFTQPRRPIYLRDIAKDVGLTVDQVTRMYRDWLRQPKTQKYLKGNKWVKCSDDLTQARRQALDKVLREFPMMSQKQLLERLNSRDDLKVIVDGQPKQFDRPLLIRLLRQFRFKKIRLRQDNRFRNSSRTVELRFRFSEQFVRGSNRGAQMFFVEEVDFTQFVHVDKAWANPKEEFVRNYLPSIFCKHALLTIFSGPSSVYWKIIDRKSPKYTCTEDLNELVQRIGGGKCEGKRYIIVERTGLSEEAKRCLLRCFGGKFLYFPPHSPHMTPVFFWLTQLRRKLRRWVFRRQQQLLEIMKKLLQTYVGSDFQIYYRDFRLAAQRALLRQKF